MSTTQVVERCEDERNKARLKNILKTLEVIILRHLEKDFHGHVGIDTYIKDGFLQEKSVNTSVRQSHSQTE